MVQCRSVVSNFFNLGTNFFYGEISSVESSLLTEGYLSHSDLWVTNSSELLFQLPKYISDPDLFFIRVTVALCCFIPSQSWHLHLSIQWKCHRGFKRPVGKVINRSHLEFSVRLPRWIPAHPHPLALLVEVGVGVSQTKPLQLGERDTAPLVGEMFFPLYKFLPRPFHIFTRSCRLGRGKPFISSPGFPLPRTIFKSWFLVVPDPEFSPGGVSWSFSASVLLNVAFLFWSPLEIPTWQL